jgi:hypothetical protein
MRSTAGAPDCPSCGWKDERWDRFFESLERNWGTPQGSNIDMWCPSPVLDLNIVEGAASSFRTAASPGPAVAIMKMNREIDVRHILPAIQAQVLSWTLHWQSSHRICVGLPNWSSDRRQRACTAIVSFNALEPPLPGANNKLQKNRVLRNKGSLMSITPGGRTRKNVPSNRGARRRRFFINL